MRVLQVGLDWLEEKPGGLSRYYYETLRTTGERFQTRGLVVGAPDLDARTGGRVRAFARPSDRFAARLLRARRAIAAEMRSFPPDLVVSHFAPHLFPALDRLGRRPLVTHFHGPWAAESLAEGASRRSAWVKTRIEQAVYRRSTGVIVLSEAFKALLSESYGVPLSRIHVVPGGVNAPEFRVAMSRDAAKAALGLRPERTYLFCIRRLVRRMGLENLVDAFCALRARHPGATLLIGGQGPMMEELRARSAALGAGDDVVLLGPVSKADLPLYYRASLFSVVPTTRLEGFGLTTLESLAAGTPVVTTPVGGLREIMGRFEPELIAAGSGQAEIAAAIDRFLSEPGRLPSSEACVDFANGYDWPVIGQRLAGLYVQLAGQAASETGGVAVDAARRRAALD